MKINSKFAEFKKVIKVCCESAEECYRVADLTRDNLKTVCPEEFFDGKIYVLTTPEMRGLGDIKKRELYKLQKEDGIFCVYIFVTKEFDGHFITNIRI